MIDGLTKAGIALVVLGIIIVIHELGHFLVAKLFKIKVETFSVGFGPRLLGYRYGDTDYRISAIPLGGYVKMAGEHVGETVTGAPNEFLSKPKWQRFLVAAAGPIMNFILAMALLTGLFMHGMEVAEYAEGPAVIGAVKKGSAADTAGILAGDRIVSLAGKSNPNWEQAQMRILTSAGSQLPIVLERSGQTVEAVLTPTKVDKDESGYAGWAPKFHPSTVVAKVDPGTPAESAGIQVGDEIISVNGVELKNARRSMAEIVQDLSDAPFPLKFSRQGEIKEITISTYMDKAQRRIGIEFRVPTIVLKESFPKAFSRSIDKNMEYGTLVLRVLGKLVTRQQSMKTIDGPLRIAQATGDFYDAGFGPLLMLMAMISVNLGLMNLLPIPILDGGVIMLLLVEFVMGHDLSIAVKERVIQVSFVFLLTVMVYVLYNDVLKVFPGPASP
jgi:regulator of sigma E protease